ncbi:hypothetical protein [Hydrogenophaga taeniospiralis]|uniref:hypothetical protein n=1 Tax=Hydrogenophaga taeniospiralis TaxID=65656 RepID=UPI0039AECD27
MRKRKKLIGVNGDGFLNLSLISSRETAQRLSDWVNQSRMPHSVFFWLIHKNRNECLSVSSIGIDAMKKTLLLASLLAAMALTACGKKEEAAVEAPAPAAAPAPADAAPAPAPAPTPAEAAGAAADAAKDAAGATVDAAKEAADKAAEAAKAATDAAKEAVKPAQ